MGDYTRAFLGDSPGRTKEPRRRLPGALTLSLGTHSAALIVIVVLSSGRAAPMLDTGKQQMKVSVAWHAPGPGGGVGGNGEPTEVPLRAADVHVPAASRRSLQPAADPRPIQAVPVPVTLQPAAAGLDHLAGLLQSVSLTQPASRGPGSNKGAGGRDGTGIGTKGGPETGSGEPGGIGNDAGPGGGTVPPKLIAQLPPQYTNDAMRAKIQGVVVVEAVVMPNGSVGDVRIVRSLDPVFGLDQQAIRAVKTWRFVPGSRGGQRIPMLVTIELTFTIR